MESRGESWRASEGENFPEHFPSRTEEIRTHGAEVYQVCLSHSLYHVQILIAQDALTSPDSETGRAELESRRGC